MSFNQARTLRKVRVFLVDDHPLVRDGLAARLEKEADLESCGEAECIEQAVPQIRAQCPDVVILDLALGQQDGLELLQQIRKIEGPRGPVRTLVLSTYEESLYAERALRAGAMGYVHKSASWNVVIEAIRTVLQGKRYFSAAVEDRLLNRILDISTSRHPDVEAAKPPSLVESLTDRELSVFRLIGQGLTTKQIANRLLLSTHTVDSHRENIKRKLKVKYASELLRLAIVWTIDNA
jgi:DNA-binding NarL/FixJ family response regulator